MARYTCSFTVAIEVERLRQLLSEILQYCNLDVIKSRVKPCSFYDRDIRRVKRGGSLAFSFYN